ncbi:chaperonin GroEL [Candidatus Shapirobacteria bacterium CG10_big_fil_rev_8_21_14_0_10_40_9]|uniref:Chaperonin GroEL n=1 Tax=Candidatus Shapirobacteria bacterium CG10_big_fil_rev_8_21_14_0_10_40_9 TaxID=1974888 RepID=A0A2M8L2W3_9BACT|nr:MAG: chaperonin GroEL [Candidatus Shapirobacteria bacterium CG10_big_fil_rev_8_21_14_0_10_40_9]
MAKQLLYSEEAREKLKKGIDAVARAVGTTLGPKGRNIALDKKWGAPSVVHDGVSVAKEIELKDPFENMGAQLIREAADKTNDATGDGTTTATILTQAIVNEGIKNITAGANPMVLIKGIEKAAQKVVESIKKQAKPVKGGQDITQIATISAASPEIGQKIAEALEKVGRDGVVTVEEGKGLTIDIEYKEGMEFNNGYVSPYFVTNPEKMEAEIENPYILITDKKISALDEFLPFLENFVKTSKDLVIVADDLEGEALATLVVNKLRGTINLLAVKAPGFGDRRKEMLEDIAILTGGTVISEDTGRKFESIEISDLGQADKVWSDKDNCRIIGGKGSQAQIKGRIGQIKKQIESETSDFDKEKLQERLAKLSGGVAQINVGAATEVELNEKKERVKDAVEATKAAIEEGIVPGGGVVLFEAAKELDPKLLKDVLGEGDQATGVKVVKEALWAPIKKLAENAGVNGDVVIQEIEKKEAGFGFDVLDGQYKNMVKAGIIDPAKVTRIALQNAVSVAIMILTTEGLITDIPEKENPPAGGPGAGMPPGGEY